MTLMDPLNRIHGPITGSRTPG